MADEQPRELEPQASKDNLEAEAGLPRERVQSGEVSERLLPLLVAEARLDPELTWTELLGLLAAFLGHELDETTGERVLGFLECNLPGARVGELIEWPGQWFGNRWLEEVVLGPEEVALYALARSGRELPGVPCDPELPFPLPEGAGDCGD